jgi:hypothetical protein
VLTKSCTRAKGSGAGFGLFQPFQPSSHSLAVRPGDFTAKQV